MKKRDDAGAAKKKLTERSEDLARVRELLSRARFALGLATEVSNIGETMDLAPLIADIDEELKTRGR